MLSKRICLVIILAIVSITISLNAQVQNYPQKVVVDSSGNVYVTGYGVGAGTSVDFATVKYNSAGNQLWAARYNGPGNNFDFASALAVDASGNVYVAGRSMGSGTGFDYAIAKYDSGGNGLWVARYDGPDSLNDVVEAIAVDASGNVYVTGYSYGSATFSDYATIKYDSAGNQLWVVRYDGPISSADQARALVIDPMGNVLVTGASTGNGTNHDYATIKYDTSGTEIWMVRYTSPGNFSDSPDSLALDSSGNIYVIGTSYTGISAAVYMTVKYDSAGNEIWAAKGTGSNYVAAGAVDVLGNVYVAGTSLGDYATVKLDSAGHEIWVAKYDGPGNGTDTAADLAVDASGNVFVTGYSPGILRTTDYATVKYDAEGNEIWVARYNGPGDETDRAISIAADDSGNVYVTGDTHNADIIAYGTIKYDPTGAIQWVAMYVNLQDVITILIQQVKTIDLKNEAGYTAKLDAAVSSFQEAKSHDYIGTINQLEAFKNKCDNDPQLSEADRAALKASADEIISYIQSIR